MDQPARRPAHPRRHVVRFALVAVTAAALFAPHAAADEPTRAPIVTRAATTLSSSSIWGYRNNIAAITNAHRRSAGLPNLTYSTGLTIACQNHANDMARMGRMTHTGSDGSSGGTRARRAGFNWSTWGENVAAGYSSSASVMQGWMGSSGHRANILNRNFSYIGIGVQRGSNGTIYYCMLLGR